MKIIAVGMELVVGKVHLLVTNMIKILSFALGKYRDAQTKAVKIYQGDTNIGDEVKNFLIFLLAPTFIFF